MSFEVGMIENVFYVRWKTPSVKDVDYLMREFKNAFDSTSDPIYYLAVSPDGSPAPDKAIRTKLAKGLESIVHKCAGIYLVFEATGFKAAIKRNVMTGILLSSRKLRSVKIFQSEEKALDELRAHVDVDKFRKQMSEVRLVHDEADGDHSTD